MWKQLDRKHDPAGAAGKMRRKLVSDLAGKRGKSDVMDRVQMIYKRAKVKRKQKKITPVTASYNRSQVVRVAFT